MPLYEYRCLNDHRFEVIQKIADHALTECQLCGAPAQRVLHPVAIHFKGSGFYTTDYGRGKKKAADAAKTDGGATTTESTGGGDSKPAAEGTKAAEGKKAAEA